MKLIVDRQILHDRKVEVHGLRLGAGHYFAVFDFQPRVCVVAVIPCQNRGIILSVAPPVQVDSDGRIRCGLPVSDLRCDKFLAILVVELVIIVGIRCSFIIIFHEVPEQLVELPADPLDGIAALVAGHKRPVALDGIQLIPLFLLIPASRVDNDLGSIRDTRI